jgi:hypothetical protein
MEPECKKERFSLVKLIKKFKQMLHFLKRNYNIETESSEAYNSLRDFYEETESKLIDPDSFFSFLGKSFDDECPEEDVEEDLDQCFSDPNENEKSQYENCMNESLNVNIVKED